jgi:hypothetical protein
MYKSGESEGLGNKEIKIENQETTVVKNMKKTFLRSRTDEIKLGEIKKDGTSGTGAGSKTDKQENGLAETKELEVSQECVLEADCWTQETEGLISFLAG